MGQRTQYAPSTFCWVELATTDAAAAKAFYQELFGWSAEDSPAGPDGVYTMLSLDGKHVGALFELNAAMREQGVPSHWGSYVSVENVDASAQKARELGATILPEPFDVMDYGRMAGVQDPTGARFSLWQPKAHPGAQLVNDPNTWCWNELQTRDTAAARSFYTELFGWTTETSTSPTGFEYVEFQNNGYGAGGMLQIQPEWGEGVPPNWAVYFSVADLDQALAKAGEAGAATHMEPMAVEGLGRFALLADPTGAVFALIQMDEGVADD